MEQWLRERGRWKINRDLETAICEHIVKRDFIQAGEGWGYIGLYPGIVHEPGATLYGLSGPAGLSG